MNEQHRTCSSDAMAKSIQGRMGSGGNFMSFGKSGAKIYADSDIRTTFADVAGQDEAKEALNWPGIHRS